MTNIQLNNGFLLASVLSAGSLASCLLLGASIPSNTTAYAIITDDLSGAALAVSGVMNTGNTFSASIDLLTTVVYDLFRTLATTTRRRVNIEIIDTTNRQSLGHGPGVMINSALIAGAASAVPELSTVLTTADFASIANLQRPAGLTSTADLLAEILAILKG